MNIISLAPELIAGAWPRIHPFLQIFEKATGAWGAEQVRQAALRGTQQVWCAVDDKDRIHSVTVTEILETPRGRICQVVVHVGDLKGIESLLEVGEPWAKSLGCVAFRYSGRKGWLKFGGFKQIGVVAEMEIV
jgi:hypothetical protein